MDKKKILAICTSPRKNGQTYQMLKQVLQGAKDLGASVELYEVSGKVLTPCMGCFQCQHNKDCPIEDDVKVVLEKMKEADGLVIGAPVYFYDVNAQCKILIDRSYAVEPLNNNMVGAVVTVAGSMGVADSIKTLNMFFTVHGITSAGFVASYGNTADKRKARTAAYAMGQKILKMCHAIGNCKDKSFDSHTHFAFGTHSL